MNGQDFKKYQMFLLYNIYFALLMCVFVKCLCLSAVSVQHTNHEPPEQTNISSADQPSKLVVKAFYNKSSARKTSRYLVDT